MPFMSVVAQSVLGFLIGLTLGLLGGGGSILTVPALVYVVGQSPQAAVTASLVIVGVNSALGAAFHRAQAKLNWQVAVIFGSTGMMTAYLAAGFSKLFPPGILMILFGVLMLVVGSMMLRRSLARESEQPRRLPVILASGAGVGLLTGFLGVGGGFLIVPALVMLVGLPMQQAVGTSLVIIAMNSLAGLLGHLNGSMLDITMIAIFVVAGLLGTFAGTRLTRVLSPNRLRLAFAVFVIGLALILLYDNVTRLFA